MLFVWIGFLREGAGAVPQSVQRMATDFLAQPSIRIRSAGPLRDAKGKRSGMMLVFEHDSREAAERLVRESPFLKAGLYGSHELYEYDNEIG